MVADLPESGMPAISAPREPGLFELFLEPEHDRYALSIPDGYSSARSCPLILVLHWGGPVQPYRGEAILSGLAIPALASLGAVMAAPDCPDQSWMTERSERLLLELIDFLLDDYAVDSRRCLIVGYSMGAAGTWNMAARHQERFSAAIPISATPPRGMAEISWHIPLYVIHSTYDEHFPLIATLAVVERLRARDVEVEFHIVEGVTHFDVAGFIRHLRAAVPWIRQVWSRRDMS